jgi:hypothetical protein
MIEAGSIDVHVVLGWLVDLLGCDDRRVERFCTLINAEPPASEPRFAP